MSAEVNAVVCLSGGLDSCVTLYEALAREGTVAALHFTYGQRTSAREREAFDAICDHAGVHERLVVEQPALRAIGGSALTDTSLEVPTTDADAATPTTAPDAATPPTDPSRAIPITYVPFRNGQILSVASAWAEALGATAVYVGAVEEDSSGYPDCRQEFFEAFARAVDAGTRPDTHIRIETPVLHRDKAGIVRRGTELDAPLHLTWSCYTEDDVACGTCESCRLRRRGFERAGVVDPIPYRDR
jgi:7-cyano-7-deazaguanine synthase